MTDQEPMVTVGEGPMAAAVAEALKSAPTKGQDRAAVELAKRYAALMDEPTPLAKYDEPLKALRRAVRECSDPQAGKHLAKIEAALSAHSVASDLGPKLLAALAALGMTVAARAGAKGDGSGDSGTPASPAAAALGHLRAVPPPGRVG